jgi:hypothetical protein
MGRGWGSAPRPASDDPRPDTELCFRANIGPVPDPVGALNSFGDPRGFTTATSKVPTNAHHDSKQPIHESINLAKPLTT